jgi:hypothetical protein
VNKRELGRDQEVEAVPTVNFSRLDDVLILVAPPADDFEGTTRASAGAKTARGN